VTPITPLFADTVPSSAQLSLPRMPLHDARRREARRSRAGHAATRLLRFLETALNAMILADPNQKSAAASAQMAETIPAYFIASLFDFCGRDPSPNLAERARR
jgi:hypothetical protein